LELGIITPHGMMSGMIGHLEGTVVKVAGTYAILSCGGVGYKVAATKTVLAGIKQNADAALWTHLAVREDSLDLYGFSNEEGLRFFELLLTVSGIGPKSALAILDIASTETLRSAISTGNASYLTKVSGIGRKTAEKIVLELRDKVGAAESGSAAAIPEDEEAMEAMRSLGYSAQEARDAMRTVSPDIKKSSERLRAALKSVGKS
jgi:holliday junction DNA helicase RuvA